MDQKLPEQRYKLNIFLSAKKLKNTDTFSKSDPVCKLFMTLQGEGEKFIATTERKINNLDPVWDTFFVIDYIFELIQTLRFEVWDAGEKQGDQGELIGEAITSVADAIGSRNQELEIPLNIKKNKQTGLLHIKIEKLYEPDNYISWTWKGVNLINTDGYFGVSDPFLKFYRQSGDNEWYCVHSTEVIKNNLNPEWKTCEVAEALLCNLYREQKFKVECWDLHHKGEHNQYMGSFITSVHDIFNENKFEFNLEIKKDQSGGKIVLVDKKFIFRPTCFDYLKDGEQINVIMGIDFTTQNGEFTFPDSLHALRADGGLNAYQTAIKHCGEILLNYDYDKKVALYGFGAIPHLPNYNVSETEHCFPLSGNFAQPQVYGMEGILNLYKQSMQFLQFSGPAKLTELINYTKMVAETNEKKNIYSVLLILTCGQLHDYQDITDLLKQCHRVPLSVILVGIGEFNFQKLELLDQELRSVNAQTRNIVQFVRYSDYAASMPLLQKELLSQIPRQLVAYKMLVNKFPKQQPHQEQAKE